MAHITLLFGILFISLEFKNTARIENFIIRIDIYSFLTTWKWKNWLIDVMKITFPALFSGSLVLTVYSLITPRCHCLFWYSCWPLEGLGKDRMVDAKLPTNSGERWDWFINFCTLRWQEYKERAMSHYNNDYTRILSKRLDVTFYIYRHSKLMLYRQINFHKTPFMFTLAFHS